MFLFWLFDILSVIWYSYVTFHHTFHPKSPDTLVYFSQHSHGKIHHAINSYIIYFYGPSIPWRTVSHYQRVSRLRAPKAPKTTFAAAPGFWSTAVWRLNASTGRTSFLTPGTQKLPHPHGTQGYPRQTGSYPRDQILLAHWYHAIVGLANKVVKMCPCHCETHI